uniref:PHD-type domain-containing protein n=1 Tax=Glossina austeni TaxID=7395 RepID=A0A1A9VI69_GLOAU
MMAHWKKENQCTICKQTSSIDGDDILVFGEWMTGKDLTVHYYCLLLSTNLPQNGNDASGILGFLFRDIRREIADATKRICKYCSSSSATIGCKTCKEYFHITCGHLNECLFQFVGEFNSYCHACLPLNDYQQQLMNYKCLGDHTVCYICTKRMYNYHPKNWIYAECCKNGFVHNLCMQKYALSAGYYLKCIWCKSGEFRDAVKLQGIFVPDREAKWELEPNAYRDLHSGYSRCDMKKCKCPKGRDYVEYIEGRKWFLTLCKLCGSFGAHNPTCIPGFESSKKKVEDFKCDMCLTIERSLGLSSNTEETTNELFDTSLYINKSPNKSQSPFLLHENAEFSDDSTSSVITVISSQNSNRKRVEAKPDVVADSNGLVDNIEEPVQVLTSDTDWLCGETYDERVKLDVDEMQLDDGFLIFDMYEFTDSLDCLAKVKVKVKVNNARFAGKTLNEIKCSKNLINIEDIVERSDDLSIIKEFDEIIDNAMK